MNDQPSANDFIQATRNLRVVSPLGTDQLLPERVMITEGVSSLFDIRLSVRAKREVIQPQDLIGRLIDVSLEVQQAEDGGDGVRRPFNGLVTALQEGPPITRGLRSYSMVLKPQMWLLSQRSDCRIWMDKTSLDIVETLFSEHGIPAPDVSGVVTPPPPQHYSVQWNETDLDFLTRRFEEDGLFYWFSHEEGSHRLHVADGANSWLGPSPSALGEGNVRLAQGSTDRNHINDWMKHYAYVPGQRAGADWNFETPQMVPGTTTPSLIQMPGAMKRELYEYPARISSVAEAERAQKLRMQASEADHNRVVGRSSSRILEAGRRFTPYEVAHPEHVYEEHVIIRATHFAVDPSYETNTDQPEYTNEFEAVPSRVAMTPHRNTERPRIRGTQVAIVAGPSGEEIHPDQYGRIKLWYPWDRRAKKDGSDTCWVRVAQNWAGGTWGGQVIPRIGMEVMVAFIDGDPDRPLVTGVVPNPSNGVPYDLPTNKTRMVMRSNTHKGTGFNEMTFEDDAGRENMFFHAQKDQTTRIRNDRTKRVDRHEVASIGGNRAVEVSGNQKHEIGGSVNTVVGGTGPMAMALMGAVQGLSGQTAGLLSQAGQIAGGGGEGLAAFAGTIASSALGFLGLGGLGSREGVVSGPNPRADAGTSLSGSGSGLGEAAGGLFPLPGIMNTVVGSFKSDTVGVARVEQIGVSKVTHVGQTSLEKVGKFKKVIVGDEFVIECGASKFIMRQDGTVIILGTHFNFTASGPTQINGKVVDLNKPGGGFAEASPTSSDTTAQG
ncbi:MULTISPECIES: type VI secretion system tip protein TssI/VgrG [unclassified Rhizobium]|jgi:type VI secretion system secreted protein VgrG|uniref:type VI secretion system tip protein TssI/VgrG n=1 Tax=unclassified Rhizobium TaxID=2613769 RepID=UPI0006460C30|nr:MULTISPECIES: type VI secretion system tip protein TssI/VgrG [unclassified Rhizobium]MBN8954797.1 type VI secretion system tip protein VgrG [Rhizobium tropici]OJY70694.1 MAG: fimbrial protein [Rhizobium sp. 60-20]RKD52170.1 type VI secretion system secreted protein VgrG [Rhizobium sp. WW_1]